MPATRARPYTSPLFCWQTAMLGAQAVERIQAFSRPRLIDFVAAP
jgi:hypothetical protein